jgi:hypothetical protein
VPGWSWTGDRARERIGDGVGSRERQLAVALAPAVGGVLGAMRKAARMVLRPFGSLAFVVAVGALWVSGRLRGEHDDLGFFAERLHATITGHPQVIRQGLQMAWLLWLLAFALALSPIDPIASRWDEVLLGGLAVNVLWRRALDVRQVDH